MFPECQALEHTSETRDIVDSRCENGYSVRGNMWGARGIALAQARSCEFWVADQESRAVRRGRHALAPWLHAADFHALSVTHFAR
jgi:hypothetical protein